MGFALAIFWTFACVITAFDPARGSGRQGVAHASSEPTCLAQTRRTLISKPGLNEHLYQVVSHDGSQNEAFVVSDGCDRFAPDGELGKRFSCSKENPEHILVRKWIPHDAIVMEFGARFGTTSCEIAKQLRNSGQLISVEPDDRVWPALVRNLEKNNCRTHLLKGAVSTKPVSLSNFSRYSTRTSPAKSSGGREVQHFSLDAIESRVNKRIDTLLIDCEGCADSMLDQFEPKMSSQINLVILERDGSSAAFMEALERHGFEQVQNADDCALRKLEGDSSRCLPGLMHTVYRRAAA